jgi:hypothetical protein
MRGVLTSININDRNRRKKSTLTGRYKKGKIDSSGALRNSIEYKLKVNENSFGFEVSGLDYADVVDGGRRKGKGIPLVPLLKWIKQKPIRLRENGQFIKMTPAKIRNFAGFVSWKAKKFGIAPTNFLLDAVTDAGNKHKEALTDALFKDVEQSATFIIKQLQGKRK